MRRHFCADALDFASAIRGSKLYIGNQSLGFALAEGMKHPRVLEVYHAMNNCQPQSANGYTHLDDAVIQSYLADGGEDGGEES